MHTIKGTAGALGFAQLESITHAAENLLDDARDDASVLSSEAISVLLATIDATRTMLAEVEEHGSDDGKDFGELLARLRSVGERAQTSEVVELEPALPAVPSEQEVSAELDASSGIDEASGVDVPAEESPSGPNVADQTLRVSVDLLERLMSLVGELVLTRNQILQHVDDDEDREFLGTA